MVEVQVFEGDGKLPPEFEALRKENAILNEEIRTLKEVLAERDQKIKQQAETIDTLINRPMDKPRARRIDDDDKWKPRQNGEWKTSNAIETEERFIKARKMYNDWADEDAARAIKMIRVD